MELCSTDALQMDCDGLVQAFNGHFASTTTQEEDSEMLARLRFDQFELEHKYERAVITAMVCRI